MAKVTWFVLTNFSAINLRLRSWTAGCMFFDTLGVVIFLTGAFVCMMILSFLSDLPPVFCNFPAAPRCANGVSDLGIYKAPATGAGPVYALPSGAPGWFCSGFFFLSFLESGAASSFCSSAAFYFFFNAANSFLRAFSALTASLWAFFSSGVRVFPAAFSALGSLSGFSFLAFFY